MTNFYVNKRTVVTIVKETIINLGAINNLPPTKVLACENQMDNIESVNNEENNHSPTSRKKEISTNERQVPTRTISLSTGMKNKKMKPMKQFSKKKATFDPKPSNSKMNIYMMKIVSIFTKMRKFSRRWIITSILLSLIVSSSGCQTKNSILRTNNNGMENSDSRPKRFIPLFDIAPIYAHAFTAFIPGQYTGTSQSRNETNSLMAKIAAITSQSTLRFQEEDNSLETASQNDKIYQKWKLRKQQAVSPWFAQ